MDDMGSIFGMFTSSHHSKFKPENCDTTMDERGSQVLKITKTFIHFPQDPRIHLIQGALSTLYLGVLGSEEKYFGLRGAYYPFKVAIFQCFTVVVQALGKISLLGGLVTFAQEEQDATAILWLSVGFWAFFALLCWNSLYPAFLLMFPESAWARIGAAFMDAALDLGYILTYLGMASWFQFIWFDKSHWFQHRFIGGLADGVQSGNAKV